METNNSATTSSTLILLFDSLPIISSSYLIQSISEIEQLETNVRVGIQTQLPNYLVASVSFDSHLVHLTGFSVPAPKYWLELTAAFASLNRQEHESIDNHRAYIICSYTSGDLSIAEQLISLYKVAHAFKDCGLVGVLDRDAWIYKTPQMVADTLTTTMLSSLRASGCMLLLANCIKIIKDKENIWFCTKGFHRLDSNDFAYRGQSSDSEFVRDIFESLFEILSFNRGVNLGIEHRIVLDDESELEIKPAYAEIDLLSSPKGTLVLEKIVK